MTATDFDVCIIGSNWAAALLAAVLAKRGQRIAVCWDKNAAETGVEGTIPYITTLLEILGDRYGSPEISALGRCDSVQARVTPAAQRSRHLTFLYHDERGVEGLQFNFPSEHSEYHAASEEWNRYLLACAAREGMELIECVGPAVASLGNDAVDVVIDQRRLSCRCVVRTDGVSASGARSSDVQIAEHSPLRSYTAFASGAERVSPHLAKRGFINLNAGTVHHVFDGGVMQLIASPSDQSAAANYYIHQVLDKSRFGEDADDPDSAWERIKSQQPEIGRQFERAVVINEWVSANGSVAGDCLVADRFCSFDPRAVHRSPVPFQTTRGAVDLVLTLARVLLEAAPAKEYSRARLQPFVDHQRAWLRQYDELSTMTAAGTRDFQLWNAIVRVWLLDSILATLIPRLTYYRYKRAGDPRILERFDTVDADGWSMRYAPCRAMLAQSAAVCNEVLAGQTSPSEASATIFEMLRTAKFAPPIFPFADAQSRCYHLTLSRQIKTAFWVLFVAPADMRRLFLDYFQSIIYSGASRILAFIPILLRRKNKSESVP